MREVLTGDRAVRALDTEGFWAVVATFEGDVTAVRFDEVQETSRLGPVALWAPLDRHWHSSLDHPAYVGAVREVRERIAAGLVYQANICRVLSHPLDHAADLDGLESVLRVCCITCCWRSARVMSLSFGFSRFSRMRE